MQSLQTGEIMVVRNHCRQWNCTRCAPLLAAETRNRLIPQVIQHEMRYFSTLTLPPVWRSQSLPLQAKQLEMKILRALDVMAYLSAPTVALYQKRARRNREGKMDAPELWQKRYDRQVVQGRAKAIEYDIYVSLWMIARSVLNRRKWFRNMNPEKQQELVVRLWKKFVFDSKRRETLQNRIEGEYAQAVHRMSVSNGLPTYYGVYELHQSGDVHLHLLSDVWISHLAWHVVLFSKREVTQRLQAFRIGEFATLSFDWVYQSTKIVRKKNHTPLLKEFDESIFTQDSVGLLESHSDSDLLEVTEYVTKTLEYFTKDLAATMSSLHLRKPDFHSKNLQIRPKSKKRNGNFEMLRPYLSVDLPMSSLLLSSAGREEKHWIRTILKELDRYPANFESYFLHEEVLGDVFLSEVFFPLGANTRWAELVEKKESGVGLLAQEQRGLKKLDQQRKKELKQLQSTALCAQLIQQIHSAPLSLAKELSTSRVLDTKQQQALALFAQNPVAMITGPAGSGKSVVIVELCRQFRLDPTRTLILTKLGKAAARLNEEFTREQLPYQAKTIHMAIRANRTGQFGLNEFHTLSMVDTVILDEAGIVDKDLFAALLLALKPQIHLVLVGDIRQLPPIESGSILLELIDSEKIPWIELDRVYRSNTEVLHMAQAVLQKDVAALQSALVPYQQDFVKTWLKNGGQVITNSRVMEQRINTWAMTAEGLQLGQYPYISGDPVIHTQNNYVQGLMNGEMGRVEAIEEGAMMVRMNRGGLQRYDTDNMHQVALAYALTAHRTQGSEFERVLVVLDFVEARSLLDNAWLYTAISRAKNEVQIMLAPNPLEAMAVLQWVVNRQAWKRDAVQLANVGRVLPLLVQQAKKQIIFKSLKQKMKGGDA